MLHDEHEVRVCSKPSACIHRQQRTSRVGKTGALTERMATRQLRPLGVARGQLVADAVEQLDVALLRVLLERRDKGPRHGARGLGCDGGVGSILGDDVSADLRKGAWCRSWGVRN
jgi:hypothetical protein